MSYYMILNLFSCLFIILTILVGVAFMTLMERKVLGGVQDRKGPNQVGYYGIYQPFADAIKLFMKELEVLLNSFSILFFFSSVMSLMIMFMLLMTYLIYTNIYFLNYSILMIIVILSLNSYAIMMMGWSSGSLYSLIGSVRAIAQLLSYEVSFIMIILVPMFMSESYTLMDLVKWQIYCKYMWMMYPLVLIFFISILVELNRSPMDFIEGESELVSGFNVEYYSGVFAFIFISEYAMIIYLSIFMILLFMGSMSIIMMMIMLGVILIVVIYMRGILPRMRYDELMYLCWKIILPVVLNFLMFCMMLKIFMCLKI